MKREREKDRHIWICKGKETSGYVYPKLRKGEKEVARILLTPVWDTVETKYGREE